MFIFNPLFTIFVLLMGGYIAKLVGVLKQKQSRTLLDFAITFTIPCLIFDGIYHLNLDWTLTLLILTGLTCSLLGGFIAMVIGYFFDFHAQQSLVCSYSRLLETHFLSGFLLL